MFRTHAHALDWLTRVLDPGKWAPNVAIIMPDDYDTVVEDSVHGIIPDNTLIPVSIRLLLVNSGADLNTSTPQYLHWVCPWSLSYLPHS